MNETATKRLSEDWTYCLWAALAFLATALAWYGLVRLQVGVPTGKSYYYHAIFQAKSEAARRAGSPKIALLGESGTYFGVRADVMARELGVPTVNLAMTASLGPRYLMWSARRDLKPGDTALLTIEYLLLFKGGSMDPALVDYIYERDPAYIGTLPFGARLALPLRLTPYRLALGLINRIHPPKSEHWLGRTTNPLQHMTSLGDGLYGSTEQANRDAYWLAQPVDYDPTGPDPAKIADVAAFATWCRAHGVRLVLSYPAIAWASDLETPSAKSFFAKLRKCYESTGALVQGKPEDFFYDVSWFQDSRVHLKLRYAEIHTKRRAELFRPLFGRR